MQMQYFKRYMRSTSSRVPPPALTAISRPSHLAAAPLSNSTVSARCSLTACSAVLTALLRPPTRPLIRRAAVALSPGSENGGGGGECPLLMRTSPPPALTVEDRGRRWADQARSRPHHPL